MSTSTYRISFEEVKRSVSMEQVLGHLSISGLKRRNARQRKGTCPFCKGIDCFVVTADGGREKTGAFNCFKCPAGGDQIELVSLSRGNPRKDPQGTLAAARELHEKFLAGSDRAARDNSRDASPQPNREKDRERRSGFDPEAYARTLDPAHEALAPLGIEVETLRQWNAGYASSGVNRGRLALPVTLKEGRVIGYMGRAVKDESPTLTFPNGLAPQEHIFGVDRVGAGQLYLVRDPLEVLRAFEAGCENVICFLTEDITSLQLEVLAALMDERNCDHLSFF